MEQSATAQDAMKSAAAIVAAIPDVDTAVEYLSKQGFVCQFVAIDKYGIPHYTVRRDQGQLILYKGEDLLWLARNHMANN